MKTYKNTQLAGREEAIAEIRKIEQSGKAEFVALYGRRRIGKTYLINQMYSDSMAFAVSGVLNEGKEMQEAAFEQALKSKGWEGEHIANWVDAFYQLQKVLSRQIKRQQRCIIFIDELPCFDTPKSGFVNALGHFWNSWASLQPQIMLIVCGSATTWMLSNLINNHGGLHNRITREIHLPPFTLRETEQYLKMQGAEWDRLAILQIYMTVGGVPYYLSLIDPCKSVAQNIDALYFDKESKLSNEYERLFASLFRNPAPYTKIIDCLVQRGYGMTRAEICQATGLTDSGHLSQYLTNLEQCDFVRYYNTRSRKIKKMQGLYQVTDLFIKFRHSFLSKPTTDCQYWQHHLGSTTINSWMGLCFEQVCMLHIPQIKKALGISHIGCEYYSWRSQQKEPRAQIDLILERADRIINICEIKYSEGQYNISKTEALNIRNRITTFRDESTTRYAIQTTFITPYGIMHGANSSVCQSEVMLDALFE